VTTNLRKERGAGPAEPADGDAGPTGTGSRASMVLGGITLAALLLWMFMGLVATPEDEVQGTAVRLLYVHVPVVTVAYLACFITTAGSAMWLWKKTQGWDLLASASGEIATVFTAATLLSGAIWGGAAWGAFWVWDARLTSTAMLFLLLLGYLAIRRIPAGTDVRARRSAIIGLLLVPNIFIINRSVEWWRSLHQDPTLFQASVSPHIRGSMLFTLCYSLVVGLLVYAWLLIHRFRLGYLQDQIDDRGLADAIEERRAEAGA
jgi:heme exporter protein C